MSFLRALRDSQTLGDFESSLRARGPASDDDDDDDDDDDKDDNNDDNDNDLLVRESFETFLPMYNEEGSMRPARNKVN